MLVPSPLRVTIKSNIRKFSSLYAATLKPVQVSCPKLNLNLLFRRNYIRQNKGSRQRKLDGLPEGFELVYQERSKTRYPLLVSISYISMGLSSWYIIKSYILKGKEESSDINVFNLFTIKKADPGITSLSFGLVATAALFLCCLFKTPRRMYRKDNEIIALTYGLLGPYTKRLVKCTENEIRPLAPIGIMPWRGFQYDLNGVRLFLFCNNIRFFVPKAILIGKNKPMRTKSNDFVDKVKDWIMLRRK